MLKTLTDTAKDIFTKPNVTTAQKDAYVTKLKQAGEFDKAKAVAATDYGRDKSLKTMITRGAVNFAFAPVAIPLIFAKNGASNFKSVFDSNAGSRAEQLMASTQVPTPTATNAGTSTPAPGGTSQ